MSVPPPRPRDWLVDLARILSMCVVVLMHWTLMRVTVGPGGVQMHNALAGPWALAATWVLQVMPVFFICGGFANTLTWDKVRRDGGDWGAFVGLRARRMLTPLVPYTGFVLTVFAVLRLLGQPVLADIVADQTANILWFVAVYLVCIALTPLLVRLHDARGWWLPLLVLALPALVVDQLSFAPGLSDVRLANLFLVWPLVHQLGVLYARRTLAPLGTTALAAVAALGAAALTLMVTVGPYPVANLGLADQPEQNLMPPSLVIAVLGAVQLMGLTWLSRRLDGWVPGARLRWLVTRMTLLLMVIFLWHLPASLCGIGLGMLAPGVLLPSAPVTWWLLRPLWWLLLGLLLAAMLVLPLRWEIFCQGFRARRHWLPVLLGVLAGAAGVIVVWHVGLAPLERATDAVQVPSVVGTLLLLAAIPLTTTFSRRTPSSKSP